MIDNFTMVSIVKSVPFENEAVFYTYFNLEMIAVPVPVSLNGRVLARISKMPVQNSNLKIFARPD